MSDTIAPAAGETDEQESAGEFLGRVETDLGQLASPVVGLTCKCPDSSICAHADPHGS